MIALGKNTGYDIKQLVDRSTRFFWAASYGQIYPELKRLEEQGLIHGRPEPSGGRARTVYELTEQGREALATWLAGGADPLYELRDEGMLKLFFSDAAPETRIASIRAIRQVQERKLAQLREIEPHASQGPRGPYLTLQLGMHITQCVIDWCTETEAKE
jgi:DNA-binding PadR family transcriptional regulator